MCGIFGCLDNIDYNLAKECTNKLEHRGPDGLGVYQNEFITFGHRRLSILDLTEKGKQPMEYADGKYVITFNGEIYNFLEIKKELTSKGYRFRTDSDTEVVLAAFCEWKEECLNKFNGMWALAIYDNKEKKTFLSRDRFGKKPLFYTYIKGVFAFASEMKAFFPMMDEVRANRKLVMNTTKIFTYESTDECVIENIKRFPAAHYAWVCDDNIQFFRYWNTLDNLVDVPDSYEAQVEMFRELFIDSCKIRMRSDVTLGTALSGGLDSSSTISVMNYISNHVQDERANTNCQHAFVACFPETPLDESKYAKMVTDNIGIKSSFLNINPLEAIDKIDEYFYLFEDLYITSPIPFMLTYNKIKEQGVTVTLDGHGADELYGGYTFDFLYALNDCGINRTLINNVLSAYYDNFTSTEGNLATKLPSKFKFWIKWKTKQWIRHLIGRNGEIRSKDSEHHNFKELDFLNQVLYVSTHETVLPTLLRNYDRYSMASGVEIRMPFMDHRLVSLAFSIPWKSKIRNGYSKSIIRDAMKEFMPHAITYRKNKIGFNSPIVDWMQGPLKDYFLDTINSQDFKTCNLIDSNSVAAKILNVINDKDAKFHEGEVAWTAITPYLWEKAFVKNSK